MKSRRTARIIAIVLAAIMAFSILWAVIDALTASAYVTQEEIDKLREEKREYERRKQEIQSYINTIEFERRTEVAKKSVLDDRIMLTGMEIDNITRTIEYYVLLIAEKEAEVLIAATKEDKQLHKYMTRVRDMEESGIITYLEIVFDSTSFADLLARLDFISDMMRADESLYNEYSILREVTLVAKADLELTKDEMELEIILLQLKNLELNEQLEEANAIIAQLEADVETERLLYAEESAESEKIQREINEKEEELRRQEAAAAAAAATRVRGTGQLLWPVPSNGYISSGFGARLHPVFGEFRQHFGVDIGADHGANVLASDSGVILTSTYSSSYGNYIVISHGNGMTTLYAHLSSRWVSVGDSVTKGQIIGLIGSTGVSTGPHLHFEVSVDGVKVDPERYL